MEANGIVKATAQAATITDKLFFLIVGIALYKGFSSKDDGVVSKPVLGRKLGSLLKVEAGKEVNPTLLRGAGPGTAGPKPAQKESIPTWYWLGADLLLVGLALLMVYKGPLPLSASRRVAAIGAVALGGILALWAIRPSKE